MYVDIKRNFYAIFFLNKSHFFVCRNWDHAVLENYQMFTNILSIINNFMQAIDFACLTTEIHVTISYKEVQEI